MVLRQPGPSFGKINESFQVGEKKVHFEKEGFQQKWLEKIYETSRYYRRFRDKGDFEGFVSQIRKDKRDYDNASEVRRRAEGMKNPMYVPFIAAVDLVIDNYPKEADPTNPQASLSRDLRESLLDALEVPGSDDVKFYDTTDTPLDYFHKTDSLLIIGDKIHTIDVTMNPNKFVPSSAYSIEYGGDVQIHFYSTRDTENIILIQMPSINEDEDAYLEVLDLVGQEIVNRLPDRIVKKIRAEA